FLPMISGGAFSDFSHSGQMMVIVLAICLLDRRSWTVSGRSLPAKIEFRPHPLQAAFGPGVAVTAATPRILVALATYNERDNLAALLVGIHANLPAAAVLVIDDASPDGTGALAEELARGNDWLHVRHRPGKLGLGTALLAAMQYALEQQYDLLVTMDADFSPHPRYLPALVAGMNQRDVMIGSRYVRGGGHVGWPLSRALMSHGVNLLCRLLLRLPARDCSGGYRCYRV